MSEYGIAPPDYRLPDALRLGAVTLQVSDVDRSLEFYEGLLGMHVMARSDDQVSLGAEGADEPFLILHGGATPMGPRRGRLGLYHFAVLLPDRPSLGSLLEHLISSGVHPGASDHLVSEALYLQDPDDLGIELYRDRPREEWRARERQIAMATDPLDARGLIDSARGAAWKGMPSGTRIGHVHLHVGSIDTAREFYHEGLGFDVVVWGYPGALFMSAGEYHHHLGTNIWAGSQARQPAADEPRLIDWEIVLPGPDDVAAAVESLARRGHSVSAEEVGGSIATDPWGTALRLVPERTG